MYDILSIDWNDTGSCKRVEFIDRLSSNVYRIPLPDRFSGNIFDYIEQFKRDRDISFWLVSKLES